MHRHISSNTHHYHMTNAIGTSSGTREYHRRRLRARARWWRLPLWKTPPSSGGTKNDTCAHSKHDPGAVVLCTHQYRVLGKSNQLIQPFESRPSPCFFASPQVESQAPDSASLRRRHWFFWKKCKNEPWIRNEQYLMNGFVSIQQIESGMLICTSNEYNNLSYFRMILVNAGIPFLNVLNQPEDDLAYLDAHQLVFDPRELAEVSTFVQ